MHHVLTLPRIRRRRGDEESASWAPVALPAPDGSETLPAIESVGAPAAVTTHRVVRRVDGVGIGSVVKLALLFYGCVFASLAGGVLIIWTAISTMGYVDRFEDFMRSIGFRGFEVSSGNLVFGLIGVAGALTLLASFLTVAVACAYNIVGRDGHGLELRMSEPITRDEAAPGRSEAGVSEAGGPHAA